MEARGALALGDSQLREPERAHGAARGSTVQVDAEPLGRMRAELASIEVAYERALRRGCSERSSDGIAIAFDEADRLQRRILLASERLRALELADRGNITASGAANGAGASTIKGTDTAVEPRPQS